MAIVRFLDPLKELETMRERMNRLFEEGDGPGRRWSEAPEEGTWTPAVDVYETDAALVVKAEIPGVAGDRIGVEVREGVLTLSGERPFEKKAAEENYHRIERARGAFKRSFALPPTVDPDRVDATLRDGVLEVRLAKKEEARPKQVQVKIS